ncbi:MAG: HAMP domain-containing histidine kinase [Clostridiales bacterium]|nr:HAMP domain-containing histidine kinase [Clostridiales bacterium]
MVISVLFSIGGTLMVRQNFNHSLQTAVNQNNAQHSLERYSLESAMLNTIMNGEALTDEKLKEHGKRLTGYLGEQEKQLAIFTREGSAVFSSLRFSPGEEEAAALISGGEAYRYRRENGNALMLFISRLELTNHTVHLLSAYDVTPLFRERDRQLKNYLLLYALILLASVAAVALMSLLLTAPIKRLNLASRKIAAGAYHERTDIHTMDEIGELSRSFNQMAEAVEEKIGELGQSLRHRDDFIAGFSHELRTPMTAIIGYADLLRSSLCDQETRRKAADYIFHEGKRLELLSRRLMELMNLTGSAPPLAPVDAESFFPRLRVSLRPLLGNIHLRLRGGPAFFLCDPDLLHCLIRNLVENAIRARPVNDEIVLSWQPGAPDRLRISVSDTGRGIPPEELPHIVEPFYMVDKSRTRAGGGAGIGLSLCQQIARLHGTELSFDSHPEWGTTVSLELKISAVNTAGEEVVYETSGV